MRRHSMLFTEHHACAFDEDDIDKFMPKLPPNAGLFRRWKRALRKLCTISVTSRRTRKYMRSRQALINDGLKHYNSPYWYIYHPFSTFKYMKEVVTLLYWSVAFIVVPLNWNFLNYNGLVHAFDKIYILFIVSNFFAGYVDRRTKNVVLVPRLIAIRYLKKFFWVDLLSTLPQILCWTIVHDNLRFCVVCGPMECVVRLLRLQTYFTYFTRSLEVYSVNRFRFQIMRLVILSTVIIHTLTCITYMVPTFSKTIDTTSKHWTDKANFNEDTPKTVVYLESMLQAICLFYRAGTGMYGEIANSIDGVLFICIVVAGILYYAYTIVVITRIFNIVKSGKNRYRNVKTQLEIYLDRKNVPKRLRNSVLSYYKFRFQHRYYRETAILSTLSEHLRCEIILFICRPLVESVKLFKNFPKPLIGSMIASMYQDMCLPNDVILNVGGPNNFIFFIATGTLAVYKEDGSELCHLEDGAHFGELSAILRENTLASVVAVEITEIYRIHVRDFKKCLEPYPKIMEELLDKTEKVYSGFVKTFNLGVGGASGESIVEDGEEFL